MPGRRLRRSWPARRGVPSSTSGSPLGKPPIRTTVATRPPQQFGRRSPVVGHLAVASLLYLLAGVGCDFGLARFYQQPRGGELPGDAVLVRYRPTDDTISDVQMPYPG